jgi:hypothetical protein
METDLPVVVAFGERELPMGTFHDINRELRSSSACLKSSCSRSGDTRPIMALPCHEKHCTPREGIYVIDLTHDTSGEEHHG